MAANGQAISEVHCWVMAGACLMRFRTPVIQNIKWFVARMHIFAIAQFDIATYKRSCIYRVVPASLFHSSLAGWRTARPTCRPQLFDAAVIQSISNLDASHGMIERC
jgi:hypothetical protein